MKPSPDSFKISHVVVVTLTDEFHSFSLAHDIHFRCHMSRCETESRLLRGMTCHCRTSYKKFTPSCLVDAIDVDGFLCPTAGVRSPGMNQALSDAQFPWIDRIMKRGASSPNICFTLVFDVPSLSRKPIASETKNLRFSRSGTRLELDVTVR